MKFLRMEQGRAYGYEVRGWVKKEGEHIAATLIPDDIKEILSK